MFFLPSEKETCGGTFSAFRLFFVSLFRDKNKPLLFSAQSRNAGCERVERVTTQRIRHSQPIQRGRSENSVCYAFALCVVKRMMSVPWRLRSHELEEERGEAGERYARSTSSAADNQHPGCSDYQKNSCARCGPRDRQIRVNCPRKLFKTVRSYACF